MLHLTEIQHENIKYAIGCEPYSCTSYCLGSKSTIIQIRSSSITIEWTYWMTVSRTVRLPWATKETCDLVKLFMVNLTSER